MIIPRTKKVNSVPRFILPGSVSIPIPVPPTICHSHSLYQIHLSNNLHSNIRFVLIFVALDCDSVWPLENIPISPPRPISCHRTRLFICWAVEVALDSLLVGVPALFSGCVDRSLQFVMVEFQTGLGEGSTSRVSVCARTGKDFGEGVGGRVGKGPISIMPGSIRMLMAAVVMTMTFRVWAGGLNWFPHPRPIGVCTSWCRRGYPFVRPFMPQPTTLA